MLASKDLITFGATFCLDMSCNTACSSCCLAKIYCNGLEALTGGFENEKTTHTVNKVLRSSLPKPALVFTRYCQWPSPWAVHSDLFKPEIREWVGLKKSWIGMGVSWCSIHVTPPKFIKKIGLAFGVGLSLSHLESEAVYQGMRPKTEHIMSSPFTNDALST